MSMGKSPPAFLGTALLWLAVALAAVAACRSGGAPARFPHRVHLAGIPCGVPGKPECLSCASCHAVSGTDGMHRMPDAALCDGCHEDAHRTRGVLGFAAKRARSEIHIDHDRHLALDTIAGQCVPCHAGVVDAQRSALPPMSECFTCHEHQRQWEQGECAPCHDARDLSQTLPETFLRHDAAFMRHHGQLLADEQQAMLCRTCHTQSQCQACHDVSQDLSVEARRPESIESGQVHRGDFLVRHAIEARSEPARCLACHTEQTCDACHAARGVSANLLDPTDPHPPEWIGNDTGSSNFHGFVARRDILSCAGCHEAGPATNCIRCHQVGGYGGNPHPNGWKSNRSSGDEMCRYCHG
jgi:hypothetical protein